MGSSTTTNQSLTRAIYLASLPPVVAQLITGAPAGPFANIPYAWLTNSNWIGYSVASRAAAASMLAAAQATGWPIDTQIMLWGWDPAMTMTIRENNGYGWVPSYGMANITVGPGLPFPVAQFSNYTTVMPPGGIPVSVVASAYPAYVAPAAPSVPAVTSWVGPQEGVGSPYFGVVGTNPPPISPGPTPSQVFVLVTIATVNILGVPTNEQFYVLTNT